MEANKLQTLAITAGITLIIGLTGWSQTAGAGAALLQLLTVLLTAAGVDSILRSSPAAAQPRSAVWWVMPCLWVLVFQPVTLAITWPWVWVLVLLAGGVVLWLILTADAAARAGNRRPYHQLISLGVAHLLFGGLSYSIMSTFQSGGVLLFAWAGGAFLLIMRMLHPHKWQSVFPHSAAVGLLIGQLGFFLRPWPISMAQTSLILTLALYLCTAFLWEHLNQRYKPAHVAQYFLITLLGLVVIGFLPF